MTPWYQDALVALYHGNALDVLAALPAASVQCVVSSPPYWGLRDYGTPGQLGLEATPDEYVARLVAVFREVRRVLRADGTVWVNLGDSYATTSGAVTFRPENPGINGAVQNPNGVRCPSLKPKDLVGIPWRVAFALQADGWYLRSDIIWAKKNPMPESCTDRPTKAHEYIFMFSKGQWSRRAIQLSHLADVRLHLSGDSLANAADVWANKFCVALASLILQSPQAQYYLSLSLLDEHERGKNLDGAGRHPISTDPPVERLFRNAACFLYGDRSPKRFVEELHRLGLNLRDRKHLGIEGTSAEFPLTPSVYANDDGAIAVQDSGEICEYDLRRHVLTIARPVGCSYFWDQESVRERGNWPAGMEPGGSTSRNGSDPLYPLVAGRNHGGPAYITSGHRNLRSVWTIATAPYPDAHFATFPPDLVVPCVKAGTSEYGACAGCGAPWARVVERGALVPDAPGYHPRGTVRGDAFVKNAMVPAGETKGHPNFHYEHTTTGWAPTCGCGRPDVVPCVVLDPFVGSGTACYVAKEHGRRAIGIDLVASYLELARARLVQDVMVFA